ncbi:PREDICTED: thioredoxin-like, partial [Merops nubicus]
AVRHWLVLEVINTYMVVCVAQAEFEAELKSAADKLVIVDFSATWCGPCKMIKPFFHSLCDKYSEAVFIEIDVDDAQ